MVDQRDPQEICRQASEALASSNVSGLRMLRVRREQNSLRVTGQVTSFYHKQLALETVRSVSRGMPVQIRVDVS